MKKQMSIAHVSRKANGPDVRPPESIGARICRTALALAGRSRCAVWTWILMMVVVAAAASGAPHPWIDQHADSLSALTRYRLNALTTLAVPSLKAMDEDMALERVEARTREILALDSLAIEARAVDANGQAAIHRYLYDALSSYAGQGLRILGSIQEPVAVPVSLDRLLDPEKRRTSPASITVGDTSWPVAPVWANGPLPSLCPKAGIEGPLVYVGTGSWPELEGLELDGAVAIMDFGGGRNWHRLVQLGAQAVLVREDDRVSRVTAAGLYCNTPLPFPRFYIRREAGAELVAHATRRTPQGVVRGTRGRLQGGSLYEDRPTQSIFAYLPPTEPIVHGVRDTDLIERIALDHGCTVAELMTLNQLNTPVLAAGQVLRIPRQGNTYTVRAGDLFSRLASEYDVQQDALAGESGLSLEEGPPELQAGQVLTIPNDPDSLVLLCRINSVSAVPNEPHGARAAANLAVMLEMLDHLATRDGVRRRKALVLGFLDGDTHGGRASRALAEALLLDRGQLRPAVSEAADVGSGMYRFLALLLSLLFFLSAGAIAGRALRRRAGSRQDLPAAGVRKLVAMLRSGRPALIIPLSILVALVVGLLVPVPGDRGADEYGGASAEALELRLYEEAIAAFEASSGAGISEEAAEWLTKDWLVARVEKVRVTLAEKRIEHILGERAAGDEQERQEHKARLQDVDRHIERLAGMRDSTFLKKNASYEARLSSFFAYLEQHGAAMMEMGLSFEGLQRRLAAELAETRQVQSLQKGNLEAAREIVDALSTVSEGEEVNVSGFHLYLGDASATIRTSWEGGKDGRGDDAPGRMLYQRQDQRLLDLAAFSAWRGGWLPSEVPVYGNVSLPGVTFSTENESRAYTYAPFLGVAGVHPIWLRTANDRLTAVDSPADTLDRLGLEQIALQARTALVFLRTALESPADMRIDQPESKREFSRLTGRTVQFNVRSGIDAQDPVQGAYVYEPGLGKAAAPAPYSSNSAGCPGGRPGVLKLSRLSGGYTMPVICKEAKGRKFLVQAYRLDVDAARFDMVADQANIGTKPQRPDYTPVANRDIDKKIVLTPVSMLTVFCDSDPRNYGAIPASPGRARVEHFVVQDALLNAAPRHYAVESPLVHFFEVNVPGVNLYAPKGRRVRLTVDTGAVTAMMLTGPFAEDDVQDAGAGYPVGRAGDAAPPSLSMTELHVAEDLFAKAQRRRDLFYTFGIRDQDVELALDRAQVKLERMRSLAEVGEWQGAVGAARECWGMVLKVYPSILKMGRESVFSVIFLMALMLPFSAFMERLVIGAKTILARLGWAVTIFALCTGFLYLFHPAFEITVSPFVVLIAFVMILMSSFVLGLSYQRFEVLVRRARIAGGEAESEEISLASSLAAAFSLGVNNLRKRPLRTALTAFTVSVLTFSIITFVSVSGGDAVQQHPIALDTDVEGAQVAALPPAYDGMMFRNPLWLEIDEGVVAAVQTEYGYRFPMACRASYMEVRGGNSAEREGVNQIELRHGDKTTIIKGIMAFEPAEREFSGLHRAVSGEQWFRPEDAASGRPADRHHLILPDKAAAALGITADMLVDSQGRRRPDEQLPRVAMRGREWRVIGLLDTEVADRIRDINGKSLALIDYVRSGVTQNASGVTLETEGRHYHMGWHNLALVPLRARSDISAVLLSAVIKFPDGTDVERLSSDIALRRSAAIIVCADGQSSLLSVKKKRSVGGLAKIVVPIILCILIVANTMLGTIEERKGEVVMLGAVGLSPGQISFLLLSEATVFSILGIIFGIFSGLAFSKTMLSYPDALAGLSFNFTSMASTVLAMSTGLVVLLATLVPARRAAALAAPSGMGKWQLPEPEEGGRIAFHLPFTLTRGNAVGMVAFFRRFMLNHSESTSQDFNCRNVRAAVVTEPDDKLSLSGLMWLAPYDLDVAQEIEMEIVPTEREGVFRAGVHLRRTSGSEEAWIRTNYAFLDLVRLQFLLWRNMDQAGRQRYIDEGVEVLNEKAG